MPPTKKRQQVLEALLFLLKKGERPTVREVAELLGLRSPATVMKHLQSLEKDGLITMNGKSRGIRVVDGVPEESDVSLERPSYQRAALVSAQQPGIPLLGRIAAGRPIEAVAEPLSSQLTLDPTMFSGSGELLALEVAGDSMIEAGILNGDYVIIRQQSVVEPGEIAAVDVDGEVTLKHWHRYSPTSVAVPADSPTSGVASVRLVSANSRFAPMEISAQSNKSVRILGKYVGLIRRRV